VKWKWIVLNEAVKHLSLRKDIPYLIEICVQRIDLLQYVYLLHVWLCSVIIN